MRRLSLPLLLLLAGAGTGRTQQLPTPTLSPARIIAPGAPVVSACDYGGADSVVTFRCLVPSGGRDSNNRLSQAVGAETPRASFWSIAASAALPGAGQAMLGVDRFVPYLALEAYAWLQYLAHSRDARRHRDGYRDLASSIARAPFSAFRPTGDFAYYERMSHFLESGAFDQVPGGSLDPESDSTTYNGSMWLLARRTYWPDIDQPPDSSSLEWRQALDFYTRRAYGRDFRWSWRDAQLEYDEFRRLIGRANDSNRQAFQDLGVVLANHLLSTVDAYITVRVRRRPAVNGPGVPGDVWFINGTLPLPLPRR